MINFIKQQGGIFVQPQFSILARTYLCLFFLYDPWTLFLCSSIFLCSTGCWAWLLLLRFCTIAAFSSSSTAALIICAFPRGIAKIWGRISISVEATVLSISAVPLSSSRTRWTSVVQKRRGSSWWYSLLFWHPDKGCPWSSGIRFSMECFWSGVILPSGCLEKEEKTQEIPGHSWVSFYSSANFFCILTQQACQKFFLYLKRLEKYTAKGPTCACTVVCLSISWRRRLFG